MSECLIYQLKAGKTVVGNLDADKPASIRLSGSNILSEHCYFDNVDGVVTIHASPDSMTMVNGIRVTPDKPRRLKSGYRVILGDFHVFRFNHPEEVRKARDKVKDSAEPDGMKSPSLTGGIESPMPGTRPDSPMDSSASVVEVADWTYAKREAMLARLNGQDVDFDKLGEEDLDKLFDDISRARTIRKRPGSVRPDSRLSSYFDDGASESTNSNTRAFSSGVYTDDTSMTSLDTHTMMSQNASSNGSIPADPTEPWAAAKETADLKAKVKAYEEKFKAIGLGEPISLDAIAMASAKPAIEPFTPEQARLVRWVLGRWKTHTRIRMAEQIFSNAVLIKEANVISRELKKHTTYQFAVVEDFPLSNPTSALESISGLTEFDDVADPTLANCAKPCIGVKVTDRRNSAVYIWSVDKLEQRLQKMRNLYTFIDRPEYSRHFNWEDPFYESPSPSFAFIGTSLFPLSLLARQSTQKYVVPIFSRHTAEALGSCRIEVKFVSLSSSSKANGRATNGTSSPASVSEGPKGASLPVGKKLGLSISVDGVTGLLSDDFSTVHVQIRLSSLAGRSMTHEDVFASSAIDLDTTSLSDIKLKRTFSFVITPAIEAHIRTGYAPIEFFAKLKPAYLEKLDRWDEKREKPKINPTGDIGVSHASGGQQDDPDSGTSAQVGVKSPVIGGPAGRQSETEMLLDEQHDVLAFVQLCELGETGEYRPVMVVGQGAMDPGSFFLRQGLQRKVVITLSSNSGKQFPWTRVTKLQLGQVRLLDPRGRVHESSTGQTVLLRVPHRQQTVQFHQDGTSTVRIWAAWDSSAHDSIYLNRATASGHRVLLRVHWEVEVETCEKPVAFTMDVAATISGRDARPPSRLLSLLGSTRLLTRTSGLFSVRLTPPVPKRTNELWRLNTSGKYVRGEEALGVWKPRGLSLLRDHARLVRRERRIAEVEEIKAVLKLLPEEKEGAASAREPVALISTLR